MRSSRSSGSARSAYPAACAAEKRPIIILAAKDITKAKIKQGYMRAVLRNKKEQTSEKIALEYSGS